MNKRVLIICACIGLVMLASIAYVFASGSQNDSAPKTSKEDSVLAADSSQTGSTDTSTSGPGKGSYQNYSEAALQATEGTRLLFFHASWCPQCRALEADIMRQGAPDGVTIFKVDYDTSQALRQKYGVTIQTTVVRLGSDGKTAEKYVAYDEPTLAKVTENLLQQ